NSVAHPGEAHSRAEPQDVPKLPARATGGAPSLPFPQPAGQRNKPFHGAHRAGNLVPARDPVVTEQTNPVSGLAMVLSSNPWDSAPSGTDHSIGTTSGRPTLASAVVAPIESPGTRSADPDFGSAVFFRARARVSF